MSVYVLVQGGNMSTDTWNRLAGREDYPPGGHLGARYWAGTAASLEARGHRVFSPTLRDEHTGSLTEHIAQVRDLIAANCLAEIVLVGHSYGGMVITGAAALVPEKIRRLVYLDAAFPNPGQSLYDLLDLGLAGAGARPDLPEPDPPYVEKLNYDPSLLRPVPKTYIRCLKSDFLAVTRVARQNLAAAGGDATFLELASSHVPMADAPDELLHLLLEAGTK